jgi:hypothetical protein
LNDGSHQWHAWRLRGRTSAGHLLAALIGALVGTATGVLPGLGVLGAMAILMPITLRLYGLSELFQVLLSKQGFLRAETVRLRDMIPTRAEWSRA